MNGLVFIVDYYVDYQLYEGNFSSLNKNHNQSNGVRNTVASEHTCIRDLLIGL